MSSVKQSSKIISYLIFLPLAVNSYAQDNRPNIIFILANDMGIGDVGVYGHKLIPTPNIDNLAKSGITFTNHYSGSTVSAPSRCALLTGKDTGHGYIRGNKGVETDEGSFDLHLQDSEITIAELLQDNGYALLCKNGGNQKNYI
ncbi:MAG: sulfatase-like hydrolase/transferase [Rikenellaceae bacterium]